MKKIILIAAFAIAAFSLSGQTEMERILADVEANNASLSAMRKLRDAQIVEAKMGNSLGDPDVEFSYKWGNPSSLGKSGEITVSQPFDFPTVYAHRSKLAKLQAEKYGYQYMAARQELLLSAQTLYIQAVGLKRNIAVLELLARNAREIAMTFAKKMEVGDANVLELNEANFTSVGQDNALRMARIELDATFEKLAGLNGGNTVEIVASDFGELPGLPTFEDVYAAYMELSPELKALLAEKRVAERDVKLSRSQSLPKLAAGYKHEFGNGERFNGLVVGMSIPIFGNRYNVKRAKAQDEYAQAAIESATVDMRTDLKSEYLKAQSTYETIADYKTMLDFKQAMDLARKALDAGQITVTEYFAQVQPIYEANLTVLELQRDYMLAYARINMVRL